MPLYQIQAPNGKTYRIEGPAGASQDDVISAVLQQFPDAGNAPLPPESGIGASFKRGVESLLSTSRTGVEAAVKDAQKAAEAGIARQQET